MQFVSRLVLAWPMVARRSLAHWRLLSSVVIGVLMASAIMAGTVIYFDSLRGLALKKALDDLSTTETDILVQADRGPTSYEEYDKVSNVIGQEVDRRVSWLLTDRIRGGRSATFLLSTPGNEEQAGEDNARAYFVFLPRLDQHMALVPGGKLPREQALSGPGEPLVLEAIIPLEAAERSGVEVGDRLAVVPYWTDVIPHAHVVVSGIFETKDPGSEFWYLDTRAFQASTSGNFRSVPFYISENTFMEVLGAAFRDLDTTYAWLLTVDPSRLNAGNSSLARASIVVLEKRLSRDLQSFRQVTSLDETLEDYDRRLFFSKLPMFIILVLIAVVILYYVVTLSSLLVEQQRGEVALLRSRGATSAQILSLFVLEGGTISLLAIVVAPVLAAALISLLGFTPAFSGLSGGDRLPVAISGGAYMMSALGGLLSFVALMVPAIQASRIGVTRHRQQAARPAGQFFFERYYLDVMLLAVGVLLFRKLSEQGSVVATSLFGDVAVDQVLLAVPALILVALAMVLLRLFPLSIRFLSGDSPGLVHLVVAGTVIVLAPSIVAQGAFDGDGLAWLGQVALLAALAGIYWSTDRTQATPLKLVGLVLQAGLVASLLLAGPELPLGNFFVPILIGIVPAQVAYIFLKAYSHRMPAGVSMGLWQMARNPTHYARLSLLLVLMAGLGIFAASFGGTLDRSFEERALYSTGADIRVEGVVLNNFGASQPVVQTFQSADGTGQISPVYRGVGSDLSPMFGATYRMFAADHEVIGDIAWFRDDFSKEPMDKLLSSLRGPTRPEGLELPMNALAIGVTVRPDRPRPSIVLDARIRDANGRYFTFPLGTLRNGGWTELRSNLSGRTRRSTRRPLQPVQPLTLVSLSIYEVDFRATLKAGSVAIDDIRVISDDGVEIIEPFDDISGWDVMRAVPDAASDAWQSSGDGEDGDSGAATFIWTQGSALTSRGIYHGPPLEPIPVLASESFLDDTGRALGDELEVSVAGHRVPVLLVDTISYFPTLDTINRAFLVSDFATLASYTNLVAQASELKPNEIWLSTAVSGAEREELVARLSELGPFSSRSVHDRTKTLETSQVDPLVAAGWRALLFIAFSAVLVLSCLGFLVHNYVSFRTREAHFALMRTIGFSMRQLIMLVWVEQFLIIAAGMALGTWMGGRLGAIIMPFLGHDDQGSQVLPPFVTEVSWGALAITYAAMAVVFALIIMGVIWFIHRISLQRVLRLGDV